MPVAMRARTPLTWQSAAAPVWPVGLAVGDVVLVWNANPQGGPYQTGWKYLFADTWWKRVSAADLDLGPGQWAGKMLGMVAVYGCRGAGKVTTQRGVTVSEAGGAILVEGWTGHYSAAVGLGSSSDPTRLDCIRAWQSQWCAWWLRTYTTKGYKEVEHDGDSMGYRAIELLPYSAPAAPSLVGPSGDVDNTAPTTLQWVHNSSADLAQESYRVRVKLNSSGTWQYLTALGALSASVQTVASSAQQLTVPVGTLTNAAWDWAVQTMDGGLWSDWSATSTITLKAPPTISGVTLAQGATGEVWWTVGWPTITTPGGVQTAYEVVITAAGAGVDAAVWASSASYSAAKTVNSPPLATWVSGSQYQAWVRIQQTGGLWSTWVASPAVTMTWTQPQQPGALVATDGAPLSVSIDGVYPAAERLEIQSSPDGIEWTPAAVYDLPNTTQVVDMPLAVYGLPTLYRARIWVRRTTSLGETVLLPSAWRLSVAAVASTDRGAYLVDPDNGEYLRLDIQDRGKRTILQGVTSSVGLGARKPRTDRTPTAGTASTVTAYADSVDDREALITWLTTRDKWWLRWPPLMNPNTMTWRDDPATLMALGNPVESDTWADFYQTELITWPWVQAKET